MTQDNSHDQLPDDPDADVIAGHSAADRVEGGLSVTGSVVAAAAVIGLMLIVASAP